MPSLPPGPSRLPCAAVWGALSHLAARRVTRVGCGGVAGPRRCHSSRGWTRRMPGLAARVSPSLSPGRHGMTPTGGGADGELTGRRPIGSPCQDPRAVAPRCSACSRMTACRGVKAFRINMIRAVRGGNRGGGLCRPHRHRTDRQEGSRGVSDPPRWRETRPHARLGRVAHAPTPRPDRPARLAQCEAGAWPTTWSQPGISVGSRPRTRSRPWPTPLPYRKDWCHAADQTPHPREATGQAPDAPRPRDQRDPMRERSTHRPSPTWCGAELGGPDRARSLASESLAVLASRAFLPSPSASRRSARPQTARR